MKFGVRKPKQAGKLLLYISEDSEKDLKTVVQENKLKIEQYVADCESKELASKYKNLSDTDVESIGYQIQILEKIRNKQKSENNFNE